MPTLSVIIPAYNAEDTIAQTVYSAARLPDVVQVIVVDDGSADATAERATTAGADVLSLPCNQGKGAAMRAGLEEASGDLVLFLDADLGDSAVLAKALIEPVARGEAEMSIAHFVPPDGDTTSRGGGVGLLVGTARRGLKMLTGLHFNSPLSGQRCMPRHVADQIGIADRFGVEVGLTLDAFRRGWRIREVPLPMTHAVTGRTWRGFVHRGWQFIDALGVLLGAAYGLAWPRLGRARMLQRIAIWIFAMAGLVIACVVTNPKAVWQSIASLPIALLLVLLLHAARSRRGFFRQNYAGLLIPSAFGLLFFGTYAAILLGSMLLHLGFPSVARADLGAMILLPIWAVLGLFDDMYGSRHASGFRGHIKALLHGRPTTGGAKLIIGGIAALVAGAAILPKMSIGAVLMNGLLIALCTNFVNLLDLRPGRALKGFSLLAIITWVVNPAVAPLLAPILAAVIVYAPLDLSARAMMGDVGSNTLGALAGLALALTLGTPAKLVVIAILITIHIYAEVSSISTLIDRVPVLRWLDRLGRVGEGAKAVHE